MFCPTFVFLYINVFIHNTLTKPIQPSENSIKASAISKTEIATVIRGLVLTAKFVQISFVW